MCIRDRAITDGAFTIKVDGGEATELTGMDFSSVNDFEGIAAVISAKLSSKATCAWKETKFVITSSSTGSSSTLSYVTAGTSGADIAPLMKMTSREDNALLTNGINSETITQSLNAIQDKLKGLDYGFMFTKEVRDKVVINGEASVLAAASWAEARVKIFFNTTNDIDTKVSAVTTDISSQLMAQSFDRTITTFSSYPSQYPSASVAGRAFTVNFSQPMLLLPLSLRNFHLSVLKILIQVKHLFLMVSVLTI